MMDCYWNEKGRYQKMYNKLYKKLVPDRGCASTSDGELLRVISKIYYRYYNDGDTYYNLIYNEMITPLSANRIINKENACTIESMLNDLGDGSSKWDNMQLEKTVNRVMQIILLNMSTETKIINPDTGKLCCVLSKTGRKSLEKLDCELKISYVRK